MQLSVPQRSTPADNAFDSKPASVREWINNLPMANIGETARMLFEALNELNRQHIPAQQRFNALEQLAKPVEFVNDNLKKHFVGRTLPLAERNLRIAHLSREISSALATGYKILVVEESGRGRRRDRKLLLASIQRAIKGLTAVLVKAYQAYAPCPPATWQEIHALYRYAEEHSLSRSKVVGDRSRAPSTIEDAYKQILLLALACPYRLRANEVESILEVLEDWAPHARLEPFGDDSEALFVVDLGQDQPPGYRALRNDDDRHEDCRLLCTRTLSEHLRQALSRRRESPSGAVGRIPSRTLRQLMLAWGVMPRRRFSRVSDHSQVVVAMGLSSIHYFVSGEVAFNGASIGAECGTDLGAGLIDNRARYQARNLDTAEEQVPNVLEMNYRIEGEAPPSETEIKVARSATGMGVRIDPSHKTQQWKMVNVSAGGYRLLWDNSDSTRAQVGELVGIREQSDPDTFHWQLGVIRWMKYSEKRGLELGVQMLSPGAVAVAAWQDRPRVADKDYTRGLLLPEIASIQQRATLLLPSPPFRAGDTAIANCHGKDVRVKLTRLVENTGSFAQFQFTPLGEVSRRRAPGRTTKATSSDFDDIWDLL
ncbi:MAG TPA: hypothetical protein ENK05_08305 [Gammaproteobacteria bacterium]|nr:hypothetical protein [Gammaproteobacteria bacterium]